MASICMPWNTYYIYSDQLSKNEGWHVLMWNESQKPGAFSLSNPDFVPSMFLHSLDPMTNPHLRPTFLQGPYHAPEGVTGLQLGAFSSAAPRKQGGGGGRYRKAAQHITAAHSVSVERARSPLNTRPWVLSFLWRLLLPRLPGDVPCSLSCPHCPAQCRRSMDVCKVTTQLIRCWTHATWDFYFPCRHSFNLFN